MMGRIRDLHTEGGKTFSLDGMIQSNVHVSKAVGLKWEFLLWIDNGLKDGQIMAKVAACLYSKVL